MENLANIMRPTKLDEIIGQRMKKKVHVEYAFQEIDNIPEQYKNKEFYHPKTDTLSNYEKGLNENYYRLKKQGRTSDLAKLKAKK